MARNLTNKQLEIVVDEIFEQVSRPIIDENKKAFDSVKIDETKDEYLTDHAKYKQLQEKIDILEEEKSKLFDKYYRKDFNKFYFDYSPFNRKDDYVKSLKSGLVKTKKYLAHDELSECNIGDQVLLQECRPLSKRKRWKLAKVLSKSSLIS